MDFTRIVDQFMAEQQAAYDIAYAEAIKLADAKITDENSKRKAVRPTALANAEKVIAQEQASCEQSGQSALTVQEQAEIRAQYLQGLEPLTESEKNQIRQSYLSQIEQPWSRERVEAHLAHLKPVEIPDISPETPDLRQCCYRIGDKIWHVAKACFVEDAGDCQIIKLNPPTAHNLKQTLMHYGLPVGSELYSQDEAGQLAIESINDQASSEILAGFDYAIDGVIYHFSLDLADQQNFCDHAQLCLSGAEDEVECQGWLDDAPVKLSLDADTFLALYKTSVDYKKAILQKYRTAKSQYYAS